MQNQAYALNPSEPDEPGHALDRHPVYAAVRTLDDLRVFMAHHVFPVWDFMSLLKSLQHHIAPAGAPWRPRGSPAVRFFINEIVLGEESDAGLPDADGNPTYASHFELYCDAMREIGADPGPALRFAEVAAHKGFEQALVLPEVPPAALAFMRDTFGFIATEKPHVIGAAFAFGREHVIPRMFRSLLQQFAVDRTQAPTFHYYLDRHIHLDGEHHGPLSSRMVDELVGTDPAKRIEAEAAAVAAVASRLRLWDGTLAAIQGRTGRPEQG